MTDYVAQFSEFHFLRPTWLLVILPAVILCWLLWRQKKLSTAWQQVIESRFLKYLMEGKVSQTFRWQIWALLCAWVIAAIALAGPSWKKIPQPVHQSEAAVVILLDLSPSMMAEDLKPSRLVRTRYKITDYLQTRQEGITALIAYAGEAHVVSPLTDDINTIINLLPALEPAMMPLAGSNIEMAVQLALQLFDDAGIFRGEILTVTDGIDPAAFATMRQQLQGSNFRFSIMGVGSVDGAPIPAGNGGFIRDNNRDIVVAKLNRGDLQELSADLGGVYTDLRPDERDIDRLLQANLNNEMEADQIASDREFDVWRDQGQWLALLLLPFIALSFRKGWVLVVLVVVGYQPQPSLAFDWRDLWLRKDQQGQLSMEQGDPAAAAQEFESHDWRGAANYRSENYAEAAADFASRDDADAHYNRGNALAKAGNLEDAIKAYETAMEKREDFADAKFNHDLVKNLLEQQKQDQNQEGQNSDSDNQDGQQQDQQANNADQQNQNEGKPQDQSGQQQDPNAQDGQRQAGNTEVNEESAQELASRDQEQEELSEAEKQSQQSQQGEQNQDEESERSQEQLLAESERRNAEQQQALEQWLRQVPDDPSGLMRRKFEYQHRKLLQDYRSGRWEPPENRAYERW